MSGDADVSTGTLKVVRIGNVVVITWATLTTGSSVSSFNVNAVYGPTANFRPAATVSNVWSDNASGDFKKIALNADGSIDFTTNTATTVWSQGTLAFVRT